MPRPRNPYFKHAKIGTTKEVLVRLIEFYLRGESATSTAKSLGYKKRQSVAAIFEKLEFYVDLIISGIAITSLKLEYAHNEFPDVCPDVSARNHFEHFSWLGEYWNLIDQIGSRWILVVLADDYDDWPIERFGPEMQTVRKSVEEKFIGNFMKHASAERRGFGSDYAGLRNSFSCFKVACLRSWYCHLALVSIAGIDVHPGSDIVTRSLRSEIERLLLRFPINSGQKQEVPPIATTIQEYAKRAEKFWTDLPYWTHDDIPMRTALIELDVDFFANDIKEAAAKICRDGSKDTKSKIKALCENQFFSLDHALTLYDLPQHDRLAMCSD